MGLRIQERGEVVKGVPVVQPGDDLFWFNRPRLILYLINFVLFQNAFQLAFFAWTWGSHTNTLQLRHSPLYALVTQMGSTMKPTIFNERVATALRNWHHTAKKHIKQSKHSAPTTPMSSRPATPSHGMSPVHLLRHYKSEMTDSLQTSPRKSNYDMDHWESESPSPTRFHGQGDAFHQNLELGYMDHRAELGHHEPSSSQVVPMPQPPRDQHEINIGVPKDFSFDKRASV
ncbi:MLO-like protein 6 [Sesamum angolense]|uniref:MLO-like protein 6 n=1 Tax=Sesamum angolense TaxID=2727404 RepID=A0AAE1XB14_9LAMI|nr:MLO-like protein 6 [Sesamum angolense]